MEVVERVDVCTVLSVSAGFLSEERREYIAAAVAAAPAPALTAAMIATVAFDIVTVGNAAGALKDL